MSRRNQTAFVAGLAILILLASCGNGAKPKSSAAAIEKSTVEISISGMTCTGCEQKIVSGIKSLKGIESAEASFKDGKAIVVFNPGVADTLKIKEAVTSAGYTVNKFVAYSPQEQGKP